ncbi:hypothetical protein [Stenotrophomonas maltophilia]|uniref:hypothetical protein n=1 Tax=Stenotrophomonas maltophilia TaxID=40324 RepID=UPI0039C3F801
MNSKFESCFVEDQGRLSFVHRAREHRVSIEQICELIVMGEQRRHVFASIIEDAQRWSRHAHNHNAAWLERTKAALKRH